MVGTTPKIDRLIQQFGRRLARRIDVDRIVLFGSRARGQALHESDVDLAVISPDFHGMHIFRRMELLAREWGLSDAPADIFGFTPQEFQQASELSFAGHIRSTGKVVFARKNFKPQRHRKVTSP